MQTKEDALQIEIKKDLLAGYDGAHLQSQPWGAGGGGTEAQGEVRL